MITFSHLFAIHTMLNILNNLNQGWDKQLRELFFVKYLYNKQIHILWVIYVHVPTNIHTYIHTYTHTHSYNINIYIYKAFTI